MLDDFFITGINQYAQPLLHRLGYNLACGHMLVSRIVVKINTGHLSRRPWQPLRCGRGNVRTHESARDDAARAEACPCASCEGSVSLLALPGPFHQETGQQRNRPAG